MKHNLLGSELTLSTTLLMKNFEVPVLNFHFLREPKCLSKDFSIKSFAFERFGPFQSTINSVSNLWKFEFLVGCV